MVSRFISKPLTIFNVCILICIFKKYLVILMRYLNISIIIFIAVLTV